ncbi:MAG: hypothetical protein ABIT38_12245 [Gemmatimonadaceae bacterium]
MMISLVTDPDFSVAPGIAESRGTPQAPRRERLRFTRFLFERSRTAHCRAEVELEYEPGDAVIGVAEGIATPLGDVRLAAEATLRAIEKFSKGEVQLELLGVKQMRAFDANVVIVSVVSTRGDGERRLLGCHLADEDLLRGTVIATLQATNRVLGNIISRRSETA